MEISAQYQMHRKGGVAVPIKETADYAKKVDFRKGSTAKYQKTHRNNRKQFIRL